VAVGGILLFLIGTSSGKYYFVINTLWLVYTLGLTGLFLVWLRHVQKGLNNLLSESPDPELFKKVFPVKIAQFACVDRNIERVYRKLEVSQSNLIYQKAQQAGENFNLMISSTTDRLTGIPNRAQLDKQLDRVLGKISPLSVIMMDIDHFKKVNDTYGHDAGDVVLKQFAVIVKKTIRPVDFLARYGGEEFTVICNAELERTVEVAERVRQSVADTPVKISELQEISITASLGVAEYRSGDTSETVIKRADNALYQAKQNGRNRVCMGGDSSSCAG